MASVGLAKFLQRLRRVMRLQEGTSTDRQLLEQFIHLHDESAFETILQRHGPMVFGVCKRVLGNIPDAEDAFQATFLVLIRKAASIQKRDTIGNWLYAVAQRTALVARKTAAKRRAKELDFVERRATETKAVDDGLREIVDQELAGLPRKYREVIVLCDLEGISRKETARQLSCPEGTVATRLATARAMLAKRLAKHGLALSGGVLTAALSSGTLLASVPPVLAVSTLKAAQLVAAGKAITAGVVSVRIIALVEGVMKSMLVIKLKTVVTVLVAATAIAGSVGVIYHTRTGNQLGGQQHAAARAPRQAEATEPAETPKREENKKVVVQPAGPGRILVWRNTKFVYITPDGKEAGAFPEHPEKAILNEPVRSPDGKRVAFAVNDEPATDADGYTRRHVFVRALDGKDQGYKLTINALKVAWSPDSKHLIVPEAIIAKELKDRGFANWLVNVETKEKTLLDLPRWAMVSQMMPDGQSFLATVFDIDARKIRLALVSGRESKSTDLFETKSEGPDPKVSDDGQRILYRDFDPVDQPERGVPRLRRLFVYDIGTKTRQRLADVPLNANIMGYSWSPDGSRIAYSWKVAQPGVPLAVNTQNMNDPKINTETESHLSIADSDGKNAKTVLSEKVNSGPTITIGALDWR